MNEACTLVLSRFKNLFYLFDEPISTELSSAGRPEYFGFLTISESFHVAANVITGSFY